MKQTPYPPSGHPASTEQVARQREWRDISIAVDTYALGHEQCPHPALEDVDGEWWCVECDTEPDICCQCVDLYDGPGPYCPSCVAEMEEEDDEPDDRDRLGREWHEERYPSWYEEGVR